jgi:xanthine dehydrogenase iron-sulfur cluster and FAD-binding subunit A
MANPKYLVQEIEGEEPYLYAWTPVLAKKKGFRPITAAEAEKIKKVNKAKQDIHKEEWEITEADKKAAEEVIAEARRERIESAGEEEFVAVPEEDNEILDSLKPNSTTIQTSGDQARKLEVTQQDILEKDIAKINRLKVHNSIEEYMLKKYKVEMLPMETVDEMKDQAIELLTALAAADTLYDK